MWLSRLCWICRHRSPHNCQLFDTSLHVASNLLSSSQPLSPAQTHTPSPGTREPLGARTQWALGLWESASAWLKQETWGRNTSVSLYDVSCHPLPVHHIFTCILFLVTGVILYVCELATWLCVSCVNCTVWTCRGGTYNISMLVLETLAVRRWQTCDSLFRWRDLSCTLASQPQTTDRPQGVLTLLSFSSFCGIYFFHENRCCIRPLLCLLFSRQTWFISNVDIFAEYCIWAITSTPVFFWGRMQELPLKSVKARIHATADILHSVFPQTLVWFRHL